MLKRCRSQAKEQEDPRGCANQAGGASRPLQASTLDAMSACGLTNASTPQGRRLLDRAVASLSSEFVLIGLRERWAETLELLGGFTGCQWGGGGKGEMHASHQSAAAGEGGDEAALRATDGRLALDTRAVERELDSCKAELLARGGALEQDLELYAAAVEVFKRQQQSVLQ